MQIKRRLNTVLLVILIAMTPVIASCGPFGDDEEEEEATPTIAAVDAEETPTDEMTPEPAPEDGTPEGTPERATGGTPVGTPGEDDAVEGSEIFANVCAACHQPEGEGIDGIYPALAGNGFVTLDDPQPVIEVVLTGRGGMPRFGDSYSNEEIANIVSYIRTAWENDASEVDAETVEQVRQSIQENNEDLGESGSGQTDDVN